MSKYEWQEGMDEISGFGGGYEETCRVMVKAGLDYWDAHPDLNPEFSTYTNVFGLIQEENQDAKDLIAAMLGAPLQWDGQTTTVGKSGPTSAMVQATVSIIMWVHVHGWDAFVVKQSKQKVS